MDAIDWGRGRSYDLKHRGAYSPTLLSSSLLLQEPDSDSRYLSVPDLNLRFLSLKSPYFIPSLRYPNSLPNELSVRPHSFCAFLTCRWQCWARFEPLRRKQPIPPPSATDLVTAILSTFSPTITYRQRDVANMIRQRNVSRKIDTLRLLFVLSMAWEIS